MMFANGVTGTRTDPYYLIYTHIRDSALAMGVSILLDFSWVREATFCYTHIFVLLFLALITIACICYIPTYFDHH